MAWSVGQRKSVSLSIRMGMKRMGVEKVVSLSVSIPCVLRTGIAIERCFT